MTPGPNRFGGTYTPQTDIASHSSKITNERLDEVLRRIDFFCQASWFFTSKDNLVGYFSSLKDLHNNIYTIVSDDCYKKVFSMFPVLFSNLQKIKEVRATSGWNVEERKESSDISRMIKAQCLNDLDIIHMALIAALQEMNYFFRTEDAPIKGGKARLQQAIKSGNLMGEVTCYDGSE